ncbi:MAG: bifunctional phosphoserine phosphatase/homoserine phosphotransferase ThrH [Acidimicrobiales bacterium]|jgi:phosphoserine/homoserine phosphotransferase|nr:bifunctional phosphoserine phosphatase/homoserine phosphotransferase ThrH [Acidimicrobiales bacterium]MDP6298781.1 bifunctional phosphoserine phosphatase/homoserine phosphotransferase ThrH [Acidimicrobiales bacterium]HJM28556.1 bifunctional phosphoserine phosphatase/homoserine phosphotransferase ThrH [Acidimicrobiales bacterium]HJM97083.1 bifunctional phosphoserine phosphatase/homoserine phosphotransferase ThrH [Acidimicrobiales bacterium]
MDPNPPAQCLITLDVEGVLTPEIWIALSDYFGITELKRTTKDEPDYQLLMNARIDLLNKHGIVINDIEKVISSLTPLEGAKHFLDALRAKFPVVLLSDTFEEFIGPLMRQLGDPLILCHRLGIDSSGVVTKFSQRTPDQKFHSVRSFQELNYKVIAAGDSYNDLSMIDQANSGFLFRAPANVRSERNDLVSFEEYDELFEAILVAAREF